MPIDIDPLTGAPIITSVKIELTDSPIIRTEVPDFKSTVPSTAMSLMNLMNPSIFEKETDLLNKLGMIEKEFDGISNIPPNHEYYNLLNQLRGVNQFRGVK